MATAEAPLIEVEHVSKAFCRDLKRSLWYGMKDITGELFGLREDRNALRRDEFWAVKDVSFQVRRGECLGLIGRNGAGKTSLLRMLNGLVRPDCGQITMRGRIGALIALGAGFNPVLTGRENIYVNGMVLGLSRQEINTKLDEIIDFAEVRDAIDAPVQTYSSGMKVRLGFAVATALKPDIMLLDEVLAVGDTRFRLKCLHRVGEILKHTAVIFVTHDMNQISRICERVVVIEQGQPRFLGDVSEGIKLYEKINSDGENYPLQEEIFVWRDDLSIESVKLQPEKIGTGDLVRAEVSYRSEIDLGIGSVICNLKTKSGVVIAKYESNASGDSYAFHRGHNKFYVDLGRIPMTTGDYIFSITATDPSGKVCYFNAPEHRILRVSGNMVATAFVQLGAHLETR